MMLKPSVKRVTKSRALIATTKKSQDTTQRREMIAREAYLAAEKRGFQGGDSVADWLKAETKIDRLLDQHH